MRKLLGTVLTFFCLLNAAPARADESAAKSRIVAVGLFKNGLAVIKREVTLGKAGKYVLDDVPEPVHGTYWIESIAPVESSVEMREVEVPVNELAPANLQEDLAGKKVTIHFKGDKAPPANGTVTKLKTPKSATARSRERILRFGDDPGVLPTRFLVVQTAKGRSYIETSEIAYVESEGTEEKILRRMPTLVLTVPETDKAESKVFVHYLTRGLSWGRATVSILPIPKRFQWNYTPSSRTNWPTLTARRSCSSPASRACSLPTLRRRWPPAPAWRNSSKNSLSAAGAAPMC